MRKKLHYCIKRKGEVKKLKIKIMNWNSFLEEILQKKTVLVMCLYNKNLILSYFAERPSSADTEPLPWWKVDAT